MHLKWLTEVGVKVALSVLPLLVMKFQLDHSNSSLVEYGKEQPLVAGKVELKSLNLFKESCEMNYLSMITSRTNITESRM